MESISMEITENVTIVGKYPKSKHIDDRHFTHKILLLKVYEAKIKSFAMVKGRYQYI